MAASDKMFPEVKPGDPIRADLMNDVMRQLTALANVGNDMHGLAVGGMIMWRGNKRPPPASTGGLIIGFQITSILRGFGLGCLAVEATVTSVSCGGTGVQRGDTVQIWDINKRCRFSLPPNLLIDLRGEAYRAENDIDPYDQDFPEGEIRPEGDCRWEVLTTCCAEEVT